MTVIMGGRAVLSPGGAEQSNAGEVAVRGAQETDCGDRGPRMLSSGAVRFAETVKSNGPWGGVMRLQELSHRSGVSTATIKYYLRAGLVPPGRRNSATSSAYHEGHLRRLRLVRALIKVGHVPVTMVRDALGRADHASSVGEAFRYSARLLARPTGSDTNEPDEAAAVARAEVEKLLRSLGWKTYREPSPRQPAHSSLVAAVAALIRLGYPWDADRMAPYAHLMHEVAIRDLDFVETHSSTRDRIEAALASAVLVQPVLQALHRLAQEEESARRGGI